jgi:hypothetical protein
MHNKRASLQWLALIVAQALGWRLVSYADWASIAGKQRHLALGNVVASISAILSCKRVSEY